MKGVVHLGCVQAQDALHICGGMKMRGVVRPMDWDGNGSSFQDTVADQRVEGMGRPGDGDAGTRCGTNVRAGSGWNALAHRMSAFLARIWCQSKARSRNLYSQLPREKPEAP